MINVSTCKLRPVQIRDATKLGMKVEMEHTTSKSKALEIAKQHECEMPKGKVYYGGKGGFLSWERKIKG